MKITGLVLFLIGLVAVIISFSITGLTGLFIFLAGVILIILGIILFVKAKNRPSKPYSYR